jgi:hypothetical protein
VAPKSGSAFLMKNFREKFCETENFRESEKFLYKFWQNFLQLFISFFRKKRKKNFFEQFQSSYNTVCTTSTVVFLIFSPLKKDCLLDLSIGTAYCVYVQ